MKRIVGIDYGRKRVGVAVSDPLGIFASPLETVPAGNILQFIKNYTQKETITRFVVGYPMNLNNQPSEAAKDVDQFLNMLRKQFPEIPVNLMDERFTSKMAMRTLIDGGMKKMDRREKGNIDKVSAAIILQSYLDAGEAAIAADVRAEEMKEKNL
ncbi:MAG: Holliday junction resolvase RuvX [Bacteroidales bacterium]|jgi:putative Holliday junction resolvase|nr:Holliday junction resolvase RuvX [Bacteroidales bacterium]NTV18423.1 Holliday junction resolvase RuvX [Bacteroidales bacterium]